METLRTGISTPECDVVNASPQQPAFDAQLSGIERVMANAPIALETLPCEPPSGHGAIEYASWMQMLRRTTP